MYGKKLSIHSQLIKGTPLKYLWKWTMAQIMHFVSWKSFMFAAKGQSRFWIEHSSAIRMHLRFVMMIVIFYKRNSFLILFIIFDPVCSYVSLPTLSTFCHGSLDANSCYWISTLIDVITLISNRYLILYSCIINVYFLSCPAIF